MAPVLFAHSKNPTRTRLERRRSCWQQQSCSSLKTSGGRDRTRTCDLLRVNWIGLLAYTALLCHQVLLAQQHRSFPGVQMAADCNPPKPVLVAWLRHKPRHKARTHGVLRLVLFSEAEHLPHSQIVLFLRVGAAGSVRLLRPGGGNSSCFASGSLRAARRLPADFQ